MTTASQQWEFHPTREATWVGRQADCAGGASHHRSARGSGARCDVDRSPQALLVYSLLTRTKGRLIMSTCDICHAGDVVAQRSSQGDRGATATRRIPAMHPRAPMASGFRGSNSSTRWQRYPGLWLPRRV